VHQSSQPRRLTRLNHSFLVLNSNMHIMCYSTRSRVGHAHACASIRACASRLPAPRVACAAALPLPYPYLARTTCTLTLPLPPTLTAYPNRLPLPLPRACTTLTQKLYLSGCSTPDAATAATAGRDMTSRLSAGAAVQTMAADASAAAEETLRDSRCRFRRVESGRPASEVLPYVLEKAVSVRVRRATAEEV